MLPSSICNYNLFQVISSGLGFHLGLSLNSMTCTSFLFFFLSFLNLSPNSMETGRYSCNWLKEMFSRMVPGLSKQPNKQHDVSCIPTCWQSFSVVPAFKKDADPFMLGNIHQFVFYLLWKSIRSSNQFWIYETFHLIQLFCLTNSYDIHFSCSTEDYFNKIYLMLVRKATKHKG